MAFWLLVDTRAVVVVVEAKDDSSTGVIDRLNAVIGGFTAWFSSMIVGSVDNLSCRVAHREASLNCDEMDSRGKLVTEDVDVADAMLALLPCRTMDVPFVASCSVCCGCWVLSMLLRLELERLREWRDGVGVEDRLMDRPA